MRTSETMVSTADGEMLLYEAAPDGDRHGAIVVDGELRTSRAGVMAAGDVVAGAYARIATAVGQGVLAARSVLRYVEGRT